HLCSGASRAHRDPHSFPTRRSSDLGSFGMSLDLSGADGNMIATTAISSTYLEVGTNQLSFAFPGAAIGESGQDGPYLIGNALPRSEEHTSELQSRENLVCRLLPEKK